MSTNLYASKDRKELYFDHALASRVLFASVTSIIFHLIDIILIICYHFDYYSIQFNLFFRHLRRCHYHCIAFTPMRHKIKIANNKHDHHRVIRFLNNTKKCY
jgi:hypothetical protein